MPKGETPEPDSRDKSIILSQFSTLCMGAICLIMVWCGPQLVNWALRDYTGSGALAVLRGGLLGLGYVCAVFAFITLYNLYRFLGRVQAGAVFVRPNVTALWRISWCCAGAAFLCVPAGLALRLPFVFSLGLCAGFMALIVRVIMNAFRQAVDMKDELDLTV
nr:DUF2975 domain-containing protein [uncultured Gemmiger sp.]